MKQKKKRQKNKIQDETLMLSFFMRWRRLFFSINFECYRVLFFRSIFPILLERQEKKKRTSLFDECHKKERACATRWVSFTLLGIHFSAASLQSGIHYTFFHWNAIRGVSLWQWESINSKKFVATNILFFFLQLNEMERNLINGLQKIFTKKKTGMLRKREHTDSK